ncbi:hypothetical protein M885DRAFT_517164 [Pelagophyceae sp. CCMP2097]|nr:hypothetical protein M885DRAFT_517164 [Pelagophyceae sp. CCMP2097]|mmetsp:Transcript_2169/g.7932  ORF Transcript_2169/g.7932 Transcript_2169/m.7932 type:complete len:122 (+) Transcript_2169:37-402(+)
MRLLTMNTLRCNRKDVDEGRLKLEATKVEVRETEFDRTFVEHLLPSLEWATLRDAAISTGLTALPLELDDTLRGDGDFLRALHHVLFDVHVLEGRLVCAETGHVFPIEQGRPNMTLPEELV